MVKRNYKKKKTMVKTRVPRWLRPETKVLNTYQTAQVGATTGIYLLLNGMVQGTTAHTRIGQKVYNKSVQVAMIIKNTNVIPTYGRFIILVDGDAHGAEPTLSSIYDETVLSFLNGAMRNINDKSRYRVLCDKRYRLSSTDSEDKNNNIQISKFIKTKINTDYNAGVTGLVGDITKNSIYIIWADSGAANTTLTANYRIRYTDV